MTRHRRGATSFGMVIVQAAVLALIGAGIGVADAMIRPIRLGLEPRPGPTPGQAGDRPEAPTPTPTGPTVPGPKPADTAPAIPVPTDPVPADPAAGGVQAAPSQPAAAATFKPTPAEALAGKPNHITLERGLEMHQFMGATFLDARNAEEFAAGHVQGAHRAGLDRFRRGDVPQILLDQPKEFPIVVYCSGGEDCEASEDVALHLAGLGFIEIYILHDGIVGWQAMGYPMETGGGQ